MAKEIDQTYIALGKGLIEAGHTVRLVTHQNFETLVSSHGLAFWPIRGKVQDIAQSAQMRVRMESGNFVAIPSQMAKEARRGAPELAQVGLSACRGVDLVLAGISGLFTGSAVAEKLELPLMQAHYTPLTPTRAYPSFLFPGLPAAFAGPLNRLSYHLARQMVWQAFRSADRVARRDVLNLPPAPLLGSFCAASTRDCPVIYGYSPCVIPPAPD